MIALAFASPARVQPAFAQSRSAADIAEARELFNDGVRRRDKGDLPGAIEKLRAAHALGNTPITGVELGRTYVLTGNLVDARETFLSVARIPPTAVETSRSKAARDESARLADQVRARIPSVLIHVNGAPLSTLSVTVDGTLVSNEALVAPRLVNPGSHTVSARGTSGAAVETTVDLKEGENRDVELNIAEGLGSVVPSTATPATRRDPLRTRLPSSEREAGPMSAGSRPNGRSPLVYAGFGVAAAGLAVGSVTGILALSKASSVKNQCRDDLCPTSVDGDLKSARTLGDISTVAFAALGAGAVVGVLALVWTGHTEQTGHTGAITRTVLIRPWFSPTSAGFDGSF